MAKCEICQKNFEDDELFPLEMVRPETLTYMHDDEPHLNPMGFVCANDMAHYRARLAHDMLRSGRGKLSDADHAVIQSIADRSLMAQQVLDNSNVEVRTFGERMSDRIAAWGGSWSFILSFTIFLVIWFVLNGIAIVYAFDPYPFIFLNLVLAVITSLQAPIIMMSQNRKETRDRLESLKDYQVNLKAEIEIRNLHSKIDHLTHQVWLQSKKADEQKNEVL